MEKSQSKFCGENVPRISSIRPTSRSGSIRIYTKRAETNGSKSTDSLLLVPGIVDLQQRVVTYVVGAIDAQGL